MGPHNEWNTNLYPGAGSGEFTLFNEYDLEIAQYDSEENKITWHHISVLETDARSIVRRHLELIATDSHHWKQVRNYHTYHFHSTFHAMADVLTEPSNIRSVINVPHIIAKQLDIFNEHLKVCALNPSTFASVGTCCFCQLGCDIQDMTLISVGVPIVDDQRANIHGENRVAINPVCSECAKGVQIQ